MKKILSLIRSPHFLTSLALFRDIETVSRIYFLHAAFETGLLQVLRTPADFHMLTKNISPKRPELLQTLLDHGVASRELYQKGGRYGLRGRRAKALAREDGDALAAMVQELISYHGPVFTFLADRIHGAPFGDYLSGTGQLIARSSRMFEPFIRDFAREAARAGSPRRLLEIGCGSGVYLRYASEANAGLTGTAIDMQSDVVDHASRNLEIWNIDKRFSVRVADIEELPPDLAGPYDLITLYNNIYYFPESSRPRLFRTIRSLLADHGTFALVSTMRGAQSAHFDIVLRSTIGCAPLPGPEELTEQLRESGFGSVRTEKLMPGLAFYGIIARKKHS